MARPKNQPIFSEAADSGSAREELDAPEDTGTGTTQSMASPESETTHPHENNASQHHMRRFPSPKEIALFVTYCAGLVCNEWNPFWRQISPDVKQRMREILSLLCNAAETGNPGRQAAELIMNAKTEWLGSDTECVANDIADVLLHAAFAVEDAKEKNAIERVGTVVEKALKKAIPPDKRPEFGEILHLRLPELYDTLVHMSSFGHQSRPNATPAEKVVDQLVAIHRDLDAFQKPIVDRLQIFLDSLEGISLGSVEANMRVTAQIQLILARLGLALECQREGCNLPAKLRCRKGRNDREADGVFQFEHSSEGKPTSHASYRAFPVMKVVPAPADKRRKHTITPS